MRHFVNDGSSIHYEIHGTGCPVVLLREGTVSFAGDYTAFGWIERLTAQGLQIIGLGFRGHDKSDKSHDTLAYGTNALTEGKHYVIDERYAEGKHGRFSPLPKNCSSAIPRSSWW